MKDSLAWNLGEETFPTAPPRQAGLGTTLSVGCPPLGGALVLTPVSALAWRPWAAHCSSLGTGFVTYSITVTDVGKTVAKLLSALNSLQMVQVFIPIQAAEKEHVSVTIFTVQVHGALARLGLHSSRMDAQPLRWPSVRTALHLRGRSQCSDVRGT